MVKNYLILFLVFFLAGCNNSSIGNLEVTVSRRMQANDYCDLIFEVKNNTALNFTDLAIDFIERDSQGNIIDKSLFRDRASPNGNMVASRMRSKCSQTASIELTGISNTSKINSEYINAKKDEAIINLKILTASKVAGISIKSNGGSIPETTSSSISSAKVDIKSPLSKYKEGTEYTYYPQDENRSCTPSEKKICMDFSEYKEICSVTEGITKYAIRLRATIASNKEKTLLEGGSFDNIRVLWAESNSGKQRCYGVVTASGIVDGNSAREDIQGVAMTFIKSEDGKILVSYFSLF